MAYRSFHLPVRIRKWGWEKQLFTRECVCEWPWLPIPLISEINLSATVFHPPFSRKTRPSIGAQRIVSEGPILNITRLNRNDTGIYTCEAVNSQGSAMINISVVVECKYMNQTLSNSCCRVRRPGADILPASLGAFHSPRQP